MDVCRVIVMQKTEHLIYRAGPGYCEETEMHLLSVCYREHTRCLKGATVLLIDEEVQSQGY